MPRSPLLLLLALCTACGRAQSADDAAASADDRLLTSAPATLAQWDSAGRTWTRIENHRYMLARLDERADSARHVVVHERFRQLCCFDLERESESELLLEAWPRHAGQGTTPLWRAEVTADAGELWHDFYRAVRYGCCDSSDALSYYHLAGGGPAFIATARQTPDGWQLPTIRVPNSPLRRHIAFLDRYAPAELPEAVDQDDVIGVLQYGPPEGGAARFVVRAPEQTGANYRLVDVHFTIAGQRENLGHQDLWSADGSADPAMLSGFTIHVVLYSEEAYLDMTLSIPVVRDRLDLARARLPGGLHVAPAGAPAAPAAHAAPDTAAAAVTALYDALLAGRVTGAPTAAQFAVLRPLLSDTRGGEQRAACRTSRRAGFPTRNRRSSRGTCSPACSRGPRASASSIPTAPST